MDKDLGVQHFKDEAEALAFLQEHLPEENDESLDKDSFWVPFFEVPKELSQGHCEYGEDGQYRVSFDLSELRDAGYTLGRTTLVRLRNSGVTGKENPAYAMGKITIKTPRVTYEVPPLSYTMEGKEGASVFWLPGLKNAGSALPDFRSDCKERSIYIPDDVAGFLARPVDLLGLAHELGHIETAHLLPQDRGGILHFMGVPLERKISWEAYTLQSEEWANRWAIENMAPVFADLGISREMAEAYYRQVPMATYYEGIRRRLAEALK